MSHAEEISLLGHLDTPILVGDPEGQIVYANPCFRRRFCSAGEDPTGQPLAGVFGGGSREAVLKVTAEVLKRGQPTRLQIREGGIGYLGLASPIEAEDDRVGVVMVMLEEQSNEDQLAGLAEEIGEPIGEAQRAVARVLDAPGTGAALTEEQRGSLERGVHALETAQKWLRELQLAIRGGKTQQGRFDVAASILRTVERVRSEGGAAVELLMPPNLPRAAGSAGAFERALLQLVRQRSGEGAEDRPLTLLARALGGDGSRGLLVSVVDWPDADRRQLAGHPPEVLVQAIQALGGDVACVEDSLVGRVTSLRLSTAGH